LQSCPIPEPRFYLKRTLEQDYLLSLGDGTTWEVLSDPAGNAEPKRKLLFCKCKKCGFRRNVRIPDLRNNQTVCEQCLTNRYKEEAVASGCEYLGRSEISTWYGLYKINACGHISDIRRDSVKLNNFRCKHCFKESIFNACIGTTFDPIIDESPSYIFKAKCRECGAIEKKNIGKVGKCSNCIELKEKDDAKKHGATWVKRLSGNRRLYLLDCGHYFEAQCHKVSTGNFECKHCVNEKLQQCASLADAEILFSENTSSEYGKVLCKLKCGCVTQVRRDAVYRGRIYCKTHDSSMYSNPNGVYLIKISDGDFTWLKLGFSLDVEVRVSGYCLGDTAKYNVLRYVRVPSGYEAVSVEKAIHRKFKKQNLDSRIMSGFMKSGFTECYPMEILDHLNAELDEVEKKYEK
jgi:hypothetical protein